MNVLLTSVGRRSYLVSYFKAALNGLGRIVAANTHANTPGMYAADSAIVVPDSFEPNYIGAIEAICREHKIGLILSLHDLDTFVLAGHRERLERIGATLVAPDPDWARICLDKHECGVILSKHGFSVPWSCIALDEAERALAHKVVRFPLIVKARLGFGSNGLHVCRDYAELRFCHAHAVNELAQSVVQRFIPLPKESSVLIQEQLIGPEYCLDVVNDLNGGYATHFACQVHSMRAGESDTATTIDPAVLGTMPLEFSQLTRHRGIWGVDIILQNGKATIIDVNPRFTGDYPFQHLAGANIPAALLEWAKGQVPKAEWLRPEIGVRGFKDLVPSRATSVVSSPMPVRSAESQHAAPVEAPVDSSVPSR